MGSGLAHIFHEARNARRVFKTRSQRGVYIPLAALAIGFISLALIGLGLDSASTHRASITLTQLTEDLCQGSARRPEVHAWVAQDFSRSLGEKLRSGRFDNITLLKAHLNMGTMPDNGCFEPGENPACAPPSVNGSKTFQEVLQAEEPVCALGCSAGSQGCESDCVFRGELKSHPNFVSTIWDNQASVGNTIACELEGSIKTILFGTKIIRAKTVWEKKVRGHWTEEGPPSLVVALAPHMTSNLFDSRFNFLSEEELAADPIYKADRFLASNPLSSYPFFTSNPPTTSYPFSLPVGGPYTLDAPNKLENVGDVKEMLAACMNPLVLVRNRFIQRVFELAGRNGTLRRGTGLYLMGTRSDIDDELAIPERLTPPVELISAGQDLMQEEYQLPFVSFQSKNAGWVNPFNNAASPALIKHHALLSEQLRACYHLYTQPLQMGNVGIQRPVARDIYDASNLVSVNYQFEPTSIYNFQTNIRPRAYPTDYAGWDQECAWSVTPCSGAGCGSAGCTPSQSTRNVTAPELVSMIGSIQRCPYNEGGLCPKPSLPAATSLAPSNDLRGDIIGLLCHLKGPAPHPVCAAYQANALPSVKAPGLFPLPDPNVSLTSLPFGFSGAENHAYFPTVEAPPSTLMIVTHHKLSPLERDKIRELVSSQNNPFRKTSILIGYFPYYELDEYVSRAAAQGRLIQSVQDFMHAFNVPLDQAPQDTVSNSLFVFSPYLSVYDMAPFARNGMTPIIGAELFQKYWNYLRADLDENAEIAAGNIYGHKILATRLLY